MFQQICSLCNLEYEFPPWIMPSCYSKYQTCGHIQQVNLDKAATNSLKLFNMEITKVHRYTTKCICPCGTLFKNWHAQIHIDLLPNFKRCEKKIFKNHMDFITHLYHEKNEYYHQIILRLVQSTYSILLAKFRLKTSKETNECQKSTFPSVH